MSQQKTTKLQRLLKMQQQLERMAQWKLAAATAERLDLQSHRDSAREAVAESRRDREALLSVDVASITLNADVGFEQQTEQRERETIARLKLGLEAEAGCRNALVGVQRKSKQWEKLFDLAREADLASLQDAQQQEWDEFGLRRAALMATDLSDESKAAVDTSGSDVVEVRS